MLFRQYNSGNFKEKRIGRGVGGACMSDTAQGAGTKIGKARVNPWTSMILIER